MARTERERGARATQYVSMEERVSSLERPLSASAEREGATKDYRASVGEELAALKEELIREEKAREADILELRTIVDGAANSRSVYHRSLQELIASERAAQEKREKEMLERYDEAMGQIELG